MCWSWVRDAWICWLRFFVCGWYFWRIAAFTAPWSGSTGLWGLGGLACFFEPAWRTFLANGLERGALHALRAPRPLGEERRVGRRGGQVACRLCVRGTLRRVRDAGE